ncbi:hypothetical protein EDD18DRAFT_1352806 [Armillaria luteobubalina]|uniref:Uncharacterized protein n=1 Tax=Armillaria luteobubalina TaxID=153913 RepID=A0AA39Q6J0_9AGAR|nr:hypothetical protein EDD18DRAFT_1352806 [Armillaria luteobubalina]
MKNEEGEMVNIRVRREQLPFQAGFACTGHVAQGQTMKSVFTFLDDGGFAAYVAASWATSSEGLFVAKRVELGHLTTKLPPALKEEMVKFEQIARDTLDRYESDPDLFVPTASNSAKLYGVKFDKSSHTPPTTKRKVDAIADALVPPFPVKKI